MKLYPTQSLERNSRLSVALVKNRAEQNNLNIELGHLEKEKKTALRMMRNDKQHFKLKYSKSSGFKDGNTGYISDEILSKYFIPSSVNKGNEEILMTSVGDTKSKHSSIDFEEIHNMLFTNDEIDTEKILCLHLISAHRTESLTPPKRKLVYMCKIHSPLERLLERSKRKNIHQEQKMANMLPIYTIEIMDFGPQTEQKDLINDGRLATRILLNEKLRELVNTVLNALKQSNPDKNSEIFEMANDISCLKQLFTKKKILDFVDDLISCALVNSCESFILTAPFRVKSIQLEIRTTSGTLETLVKQIRQNVLQLPTRAEVKSVEIIAEEEENSNSRKSSFIRGIYNMSRSRRPSDEGGGSKTIEGLYSEKQPRRSSDTEKKMGRHIDQNFVQKNINEAATAKKVEYDTDEDSDYYHRPRRSSQNSNRSRRSSDQSSLLDRPNLQPITISDEVAAIMIEKQKSDIKEEKESQINAVGCPTEKDKLKDSCSDQRSNKRRSSGSDNEQIKIHLKQTTCPACMERYKIPLPPPKTPRVKPSSVIPLAPGENPNLKTNNQNRISMLINKEMFKLQSYERRFSSDENSRRTSLKKKEMETCSSSYLHLSALELAKIEQEIKEKETQKKLEKFLKE